MAVDRTATVLGRVKHIVIDGTNYPVESTGVTVTYTAEYSLKPVVGSAAPRKTLIRQSYRVDALLIENTLANLKLAWDAPGTITVDAPTGIATLAIGLTQQVTVHTLEVHGYVYGVNKYRKYIFRKACLFELKPQQHTPTGLVLIPVTFFCYPDETQAAGSEFGSITQDT